LPLPQPWHAATQEPPGLSRPTTDPVEAASSPANAGQDAASPFRLSMLRARRVCQHPSPVSNPAEPLLWGCCRQDTGN